MIIRVISISNNLSQLEKKEIEYYLKQLPENIKIRFTNIKSIQNSKLTKAETLKKESELIFGKLQKDELVVSWDLNGKHISSLDFSNFLLKSRDSNKKISFIIGGSYGLSSKILKISDFIFSASMLTFPHRLFKLILVEQIYRAHTIMNNMPYHK
jgi:23S rRNA (pseudouridine1915-N3)-methyltransferase